MKNIHQNRTLNNGQLEIFICITVFSYKRYNRRDFQYMGGKVTMIVKSNHVLLGIFWIMFIVCFYNQFTI